MTDKQSLKPYVTPLGAWALALGTSIGWGSLVVTSNSYLLQSGPLGSVAGMFIGMLMMLVIGRNYSYLISSYPDAGGAYAYTKEIFGYDRAFLASWFLILTYIAMFWANATALPLFARNFLGDFFRFGELYSIFGYDVYIGEILLTLAAIFVFALLCTRSSRIVINLMTSLVLLFSVGITVCFAAAMLGFRVSSYTMAPAYLPDRSAVMQIIRVACISPWAFIGFENISHASEEFTFNRSKVFKILTLAIVTTTLLYIFVLLLSVSAYPAQYGSWREYIGDLGNLSGIEGLPAFYAADHYLGSLGVHLLTAALLSLVITSLIGNITALSRLLYAMAKDSVIGQRYAELNSFSVPQNAILLIALLSVPVPFLGRTAIGWIVDVTTIGATLIYGFVSAGALKLAKSCSDRTEILTGRLGLILMVLIGGYLLLPNLFTAGSMEKESYFIFVVWGVLGFLFFRSILNRDDKDRFGKSLIVWIVMLSLILFIALIWMTQSMITSTESVMNSINEHFAASGEMTADRASDLQFIDGQIEDLEHTNTRTIFVVIGLFVFALAVMFTNYNFMQKKQREKDLALSQAQDRVNTDPLTGVKSKHAFLEYEGDIDMQIAGGTPSPFAVAVCDVNGLKYINDTYGHKAGDEHIRRASHMVCDFFKHSPVFRIGGDEFVVVLTGRDYDSRKDILESLNRCSEEHIGTPEVVIAAGYSDYLPESDHALHDAFERADALMYENKQALKAKGSISR